MSLPPESSIGNRGEAVSIDDGVSAHAFANKHVKLDDENFLLWCQQVKLLIRGLGLEHFLNEDTPIPAKMTTNIEGERVINPAYLQFIKQDSPLASWMFSTISPRIISHFVISETSAAIWSGR
ncbi:hypothetical protein GQ457_17G023410 [Hibiscus cannabinus]